MLELISSCEALCIYFGGSVFVLSVLVWFLPHCFKLGVITMIIADIALAAGIAFPRKITEYLLEQGVPTSYFLPPDQGMWYGIGAGVGLFVLCFALYYLAYVRPLKRRLSSNVVNYDKNSPQAKFQSPKSQKQDASANKASFKASKAYASKDAALPLTNDGSTTTLNEGSISVVVGDEEEFAPKKFLKQKSRKRGRHNFHLQDESNLTNLEGNPLYAGVKEDRASDMRLSPANAVSPEIDVLKTNPLDGVVADSELVHGSAVLADQALSGVKLSSGTDSELLSPAAMAKAAGVINLDYAQNTLHPSFDDASGNDQEGVAADKLANGGLTTGSAVTSHDFEHDSDYASAHDSEHDSNEDVRSLAFAQALESSLIAKGDASVEPAAEHTSDNANALVSENGGDNVAKLSSKHDITPSSMGALNAEAIFDPSLSKPLSALEGADVKSPKATASEEMDFSLTQNGSNAHMGNLDDQADDNLVAEHVHVPFDASHGEGIDVEVLPGSKVGDVLNAIDDGTLPASLSSAKPDVSLAQDNSYSFADVLNSAQKYQNHTSGDDSGILVDVTDDIAHNEQLSHQDLGLNLNSQESQVPPVEALSHAQLKNADSALEDTLGSPLDLEDSLGSSLDDTLDSSLVGSVDAPLNTALDAVDTADDESLDEEPILVKHQHAITVDEALQQLEQQEDLADTEQSEVYVSGEAYAAVANVYDSDGGVDQARAQDQVENHGIANHGIENHGATQDYLPELSHSTDFGLAPVVNLDPDFDNPVASSPRYVDERDDFDMDVAPSVEITTADSDLDDRVESDAAVKSGALVEPDALVESQFDKLDSLVENTQLVRPQTLDLAEALSRLVNDYPEQVKMPAHSEFNAPESDVNTGAIPSAMHSSKQAQNPEHAMANVSVNTPSYAEPYLAQGSTANADSAVESLSFGFTTKHAPQSYQFKEQPSSYMHTRYTTNFGTDELSNFLSPKSKSGVTNVIADELNELYLDPDSHNAELQAALGGDKALVDGSTLGKSASSDKSANTVALNQPNAAVSSSGISQGVQALQDSQESQNTQVPSDISVPYAGAEAEQNLAALKQDVTDRVVPVAAEATETDSLSKGNKDALAANALDKVEAKTQDSRKSQETPKSEADVVGNTVNDAVVITPQVESQAETQDVNLAALSDHDSGEDLSSQIIPSIPLDQVMLDLVDDITPSIPVDQVANVALGSAITPNSLDNALAQAVKQADHATSAVIDDVKVDGAIADAKLDGDKLSSSLPAAKVEATDIIEPTILADSVMIEGALASSSPANVVDTLTPVDLGAPSALDVSDASNVADDAVVHVTKDALVNTGVAHKSLADSVTSDIALDLDSVIPSIPATSELSAIPSDKAKASESAAQQGNIVSKESKSASLPESTKSADTIKPTATVKPVKSAPAQVAQDLATSTSKAKLADKEATPLAPSAVVNPSEAINPDALPASVKSSEPTKSAAQATPVATVKTTVSDNLGEVSATSQAKAPARKASLAKSSLANRGVKANAERVGGSKAKVETRSDDASKVKDQSIAQGAASQVSSATQRAQTSQANPAAHATQASQVVQATNLKPSDAKSGLVKESAHTSGNASGNAKVNAHVGNEVGAKAHTADALKAPNAAKVGNTVNGISGSNATNVANTSNAANSLNVNPQSKATQATKTVDENRTHLAPKRAAMRRLGRGIAALSPRAVEYGATHQPAHIAAKNQSTLQANALDPRERQLDALGANPQGVHPSLGKAQNLNGALAGQDVNGVNGVNGAQLSEDALSIHESTENKVNRPSLKSGFGKNISKPGNVLAARNVSTLLGTNRPQDMGGMVANRANHPSLAESAHGHNGGLATNAPEKQHSLKRVYRGQDDNQAAKTMQAPQSGLAAKSVQPMSSQLNQQAVSGSMVNKAQGSLVSGTKSAPVASAQVNAQGDTKVHTVNQGANAALKAETNTTVNSARTLPASAQKSGVQSTNSGNSLDAVNTPAKASSLKSHAVKGISKATDLAKNNSQAYLAHQATLADTTTATTTATTGSQASLASASTTDAKDALTGKSIGGDKEQNEASLASKATTTSGTATTATTNPHSQAQGKSVAATNKTATIKVDANKADVNKTEDTDFSKAKAQVKANAQSSAKADTVKQAKSEDSVGNKAASKAKESGDNTKVALSAQPKASSNTSARGLGKVAPRSSTADKTSSKASDKVTTKVSDDKISDKATGKASDNNASATATANATANADTTEPALANVANKVTKSLKSDKTKPAQASTKAQSQAPNLAKTPAKLSAKAASQAQQDVVADKNAPSAQSVKAANTNTKAASTNAKVASNNAKADSNVESQTSSNATNKAHATNTANEAHAPNTDHAAHATNAAASAKTNAKSNNSLKAKSLGDSALKNNGLVIEPNNTLEQESALSKALSQKAAQALLKGKTAPQTSAHVANAASGQVAVPDQPNSGVKGAEHVTNNPSKSLPSKSLARISRVKPNAQSAVKAALRAEPSLGEQSDGVKNGEGSLVSKNSRTLSKPKSTNTANSNVAPSEQGDSNSTEVSSLEHP